MLNYKNTSPACILNFPALYLDRFPFILKHIQGCLNVCTPGFDNCILLCATLKNFAIYKIISVSLQLQGIKKNKIISPGVDAGTDFLETVRITSVISDTDCQSHLDKLKYRLSESTR